MRLSDVMSGLELAIYPVVGMLMFLSVFIWATARVMNRKAIKELEAAAQLPLREDGPETETHR